MVRSVPSYGPMAVATAMAGGRLQQPSGVSGVAADQQPRQTAPRVGWSRGAPHPAQIGARTTAAAPSASGRRRSAAFLNRSLVGNLDPFGVAPQPLERIELARLRREHVHDEREE